LPSLPDIHKGESSSENPVRVMARIFGYVAAVLNDPEVLATGDDFFAAMTRATERYQLTLEPAPAMALTKGGTDDDS
jgi:hypothetical protein